MSRNQLCVGISAAQEGRTCVKVGALGQRKGNLELAATHVEEAGVTERSRVPPADNGEKPRSGLNARSSHKFAVHVHL
jgi:hypothetical protein